MESKFLDEDVDVVSLANKRIIIRCFFGRDYNKILMGTGKLSWSVGVTTATQLVCLTWFTGPTFPLPATAV